MNKAKTTGKKRIAAYFDDDMIEKIQARAKRIGVEAPTYVKMIVIASINQTKEHI